jgi:hypothetical protein
MQLNLFIDSRFLTAAAQDHRGGCQEQDQSIGTLHGWNPFYTPGLSPIKGEREFGPNHTALKEEMDHRAKCFPST